MLFRIAIQRDHKGNSQIKTIAPILRANKVNIYDIQEKVEWVLDRKLNWSPKGYVVDICECQGTLIQYFKIKKILYATSIKWEGVRTLEI